MQKIVAVSFKVLLLICALYSVSFFTKTAIKEYTLHEARDVLESFSTNPEAASRRQQKALMLTAINKIDSAPNTVVNVAQSYALKARLYHSLSSLEVWPAKRNQQLKKAIYNNYNAINISHYNLQYWLFDLQIQNEINADQRELFWSLANVLTLDKWNYDVLSYASFYCVLQWKNLPATLKEPCSETLKNVWQHEVYKGKLVFHLSGIYRFEDIVEEMIR